MEDDSLFRVRDTLQWFAALILRVRLEYHTAVPLRSCCSFSDKRPRRPTSLSHQKTHKNYICTAHVLHSHRPSGTQQKQCALGQCKFLGLIVLGRKT